MMDLFKIKIRFSLAKLLRRYGKHSFVNSLGTAPNILDIGCGNSSVLGVKSIRPDCSYTGIDIQDYNQTEFSLKMIDNYIKTSPEDFAQTIESLKKEYDAVISSHNLEHTYEPEKVLESMLNRIKKGGSIYLSFPSSKSVNFPSRIGTLNYYDDSTHLNEPPDFEEILKVIENKGFTIDIAIKEYSPLILFLLGFLLEPLSLFSGKVMPGIWEYYGFESIIHASRK